MRTLILAGVAGALCCAAALAQHGARDRDRDGDRDSDRRVVRSGAQRVGDPDPYAVRPGDANPYVVRPGDSNPYVTRPGDANPYATRAGDPNPYATRAPILVDDEGRFRGTLSANPFESNLSFFNGPWTLYPHPSSLFS